MVLTKCCKIYSFDQEDAVIMSDCGKGLVAAADSLRSIQMQYTDIVANALRKFLRHTISQKSVSNYSGVRHLKNQMQDLMLYLLRSEPKIQIVIIISGMFHQDDGQLTHFQNLDTAILLRIFKNVSIASSHRSIFISHKILI